MDNKLPDISLLDQVLHPPFSSEVPQTDPSTGPTFDNFTIPELDEVDLDALLQNDSSLTGVDQIGQNNQIFPEILPYSTPPYSPSDGLLEASQPPDHNFANIPNCTGMANPTAVNVKPELPYVDTYSHDSQWISSLLSTAMPGGEGIKPAGPTSSAGSTPSVTLTDISKIEATLNSMTSKGTSLPEVERLKASLRREERLRKNRESSCISRKRRKEYLQSLQDRLKEAASKNSLLLQENDLLRKKVHKLEEENNHLKTSSSSAASSPMNGRVAVMVVMVLLGFSIGFFPTRTSVFRNSLDPMVTETAVVPSIAHRRLLSVDYSRTDVNPKTKALVLRASGTKGLVLPTAKSKGTVAVQGMLNKVISQPSVVNHSVTVNQSLDKELQNCFKIWKKHNEKKPSTSISMFVFESCKRLLSQVPSDQYSELMLHSDSWPNSDKVYQSQTPLEMFAESFQRDLDKYYIISLKDHLLLQASQVGNMTAPKLSIIVPTYNVSGTTSKGTIPLVQIDCSVYSMRKLHWDYKS